MFNLFRIHNIRQYLTQEATQVLVSSLAMLHIDYANSLLVGLPQCDIQKLQTIQNMAAKLTLKRIKYDSCMAAFIDLHWLPIREHIEFKVLTLVHQCLDQKAPLYLIEMLTRKDERRSGLRSNAQVRLLEVPRTSKKTFASCAFSVFGPTKWNALPNNIRSILDNELFCKRLKTHLFQILQSYNHSQTNVKCS